MEITLQVYIRYPTGLCLVDSIPCNDYTPDEINQIISQMKSKHGRETECILKRSKKEA